MRCTVLGSFLVLAWTPWVWASNLVPNPSFEDGKDVPTGWAFSSSKVSWAEGGRTGDKALRITNQDPEGNEFATCQVPLEPGRAYRISFWAKAETPTSGGCLISGPVYANRDFQVTDQWAQHGFVFQVPEAFAQDPVRIGHWHEIGSMLFDDVSIVPVMPVYRTVEGMTLCNGEEVNGANYTFSTSFGGEETNLCRPLVQVGARFNSDRWVFGEGASLEFDHQVPGRKQVSGHVTVSLIHREKGSCLIEANSNNGEWKRVAALDAEGEFVHELPASLFPCDKVQMRISSLSGSSFQVDSFRLEAALDKDKGGSMIEGKTTYLNVAAKDEELEVTVASLGDLLPGAENEARIGLKGIQDPSEVEVSLMILDRETGKSVYETREKCSVGPAQETSVTLPYSLSLPGEFDVSLVVKKRGKILYDASAPFHVARLYDSGYGSSLPSEGPVKLWWCDATRKIHRTRPVPDRSSKEVSLSAAKGEFEPVQVVIRPDQFLHGLTARVEDFTSKKGSISAQEVKILYVTYHNVTHPSDPTGCKDWWPDALPELKTPLDINAGQNQPLWIRVHVPHGIPAGNYASALKLEAGPWKAEVPLKLRVWDFDLPEKPSIVSAFGINPENIWQYHHVEGQDRRAVWDLYMQSYREHRISPYRFWMDPIDVQFIDGNGSQEPRVKVNFDAWDRDAERYLKGFTSFSLPLEGMGSGTFFSRQYGEMGGFKQGTSEYVKLFTDYGSQLVTHLKDRGWLDEAYAYWFDEPDPKDYDFVREGMGLLKQCMPGLNRMLTEQPVDSLFGAVDTWCPILDAYQPEMCQARQKAGEHIWWYVCCGPRAPYPGLFIDHDAIELRMWLWMTYKYKVEGILVWESTYWHSPTAFPDRLQDPYQDPMGYQTGYGFSPGYVGYWGNGDGRFVYPPYRDLEDMTPCVEGPVDSIRWEMLREGLEDVEYFKILEKALIDAQVGLVEARKNETFAETLTASEPDIQNREGADLDLVPMRRRATERTLSDARQESEDASRKMALGDLLDLDEKFIRSLTEFTRDPEVLLKRREAVAQAIEEMR